MHKNKVFRHDDPFRDTHYPPLDRNCRCTVQALDADEIKEENIRVETSESAERLAAETPPGEGWNYNVGKAAYVNDLLMWNKVSRLEASDSVKVSILRELMNSEPRAKAFEGFIDRIVESRKPTGETFTAGFFEPDIIKELQKRNIELSTGVITINDKSIIHSIREAHQKNDTAPTIDDLKKIPSIFDKSEEIYFDKRKGPILYTYPTTKTKTEKGTTKIVIEIAYKLKKSGEVNYIKTLLRVPETNLKDKNIYEKIK